MRRLRLLCCMQGSCTKLKALWMMVMCCDSQLCPSLYPPTCAEWLCSTRLGHNLCNTAIFTIGVSSPASFQSKQVIS
ncbi:hypothetical protein FN846DRAFT_933560, partial [Sphaerosporella brunnea]